MEYQKTQHSIFLHIILLGSIFFILFAYIKQLGDNPLPLAVTIILVLFLVCIWLLFYKLQIRINEKTITAVFGIGLLKKEFPLKEIDLNTLEIVKINFLTGIGIRITSKGTLWNVKTGKALFFNTKDASKIFFVGTDDAEKIIQILKK